MVGGVGEWACHGERELGREELVRVSVSVRVRSRRSMSWRASGEWERGLLPSRLGSTLQALLPLGVISDVGVEVKAEVEER